jgi:DNA-binding HxlR family transcriptional regulator
MSKTRGTTVGELTPYCRHYHQAVQVIGQRWTPEIVRALLAGKIRFMEFTAAIPGLSDRLLSERLKMLEAEGIVTREVLPTKPVRIEYRLTSKGRGLARVVAELAAWAETWVTAEDAEALSHEAGVPAG